MKLSLAHKLIGSSVLATVLAVVIGWMGVSCAKRLGKGVDEIGLIQMPRIMALAESEYYLEQLVKEQRTLLYPELTVEERAAARAAFFKHREAYRASMAVYNSFPKTEEETALYATFKDRAKTWADANDVFFEAHDEMVASGVTNPAEVARLMEGFIGDHFHGILSVSESIAEGEPLDKGRDPKTCPYGVWLQDAEQRYPQLARFIRNSHEAHDAYHAAADAVALALIEAPNNPESAEYLAWMKAAMGDVFKCFDLIRQQADIALVKRSVMSNAVLGDGARLREATMEVLDALVATSDSFANAAVEKAKKDRARVEWMMWATMLFGGLATLLVGTTLALTLSRKIRRSIGSMESGAQQVSTAVAQVTGNSQSLAESASEQAASLEEISASISEMNALTKANEEGSLACQNMTKNVTEHVESGVEAVEQMNSSIERIKVSADETAKIVQSIDEIAFQTNILALNAAVEAARAGEAGAGFAVVADEVRSLAQRCAQSAQDTAKLIGESKQNVDDGVTLSAQVSSLLQQVSTAVGEMHKRVAEVTQASSENKRGIQQVTTAIQQMETITQTNAAGAEEMAAAAQEMLSQTDAMQATLGELLQVVEGQQGSQAVSGTAQAGVPPILAPSISRTPTPLWQRMDTPEVELTFAEK